jgi:hypothetical protein
VPNGPPIKRDRVAGGHPLKRLEHPGLKQFDTEVPIVGQI